VREMFEVADRNSDNVLEMEEFVNFSAYIAEAVGSLPC